MRIDFDSEETARVVRELVWIGYLWSVPRSPLVHLALEQTARRLGGQVRFHPEPEEVWDTDLQLTIVDNYLVTRLPCGDAEIVTDLYTSHRLMILHDQYFDHRVKGSVPGSRNYDIIWDSTPGRAWCNTITTVKTTAFDSFKTKVVHRYFQFVGYPWWGIVAGGIINQYERLIPTSAPRSYETVCFVLADVESPVKKDENTVLFPRDVIAGYWVRQFTLAAAALAMTM
jgi:hypothetical protein